MSEPVSTSHVGTDGEAQSAIPGNLDEDLWDRVEGVRHRLTRILNPAKLTPFLRQCKVIDEQDEDEVLNSTQYPLRISKAGRLVDILHGRGQRGLQAFMECLEFYHPEEYSQLTGCKPTQRCSMLVDEEGQEGLTQFLLMEVRKLREQLRLSRQCERRLSQRCRVAEEERSRAEWRMEELRHDRLQLERMRQDWETGSRELVRLKDRHLDQAVKYSRALEDQAKASVREQELLQQLEQLKNRLLDAEKRAEAEVHTALAQTEKRVSFCPISVPMVPELPNISLAKDADADTKALLDILQQDHREAAEQRSEMCSTIYHLQEELETVEAHRDKLTAGYEQLRVKLRTVQLDWETEQKRSISYLNQIMELERERNQALHSRDSLQLEYTDCLLEKDRLRKQITELQSSLNKLQREAEREREKEQERTREQSCAHSSHLCFFSNDHCFEPCCSLKLSASCSDSSHQFPGKSPSTGQASELSERSYSNSEENLLTSTEDNEKDINRLSTFAFPPCMNSINRRAHTEFDADSWASDEHLTGDLSDNSLSNSCSSLHTHCPPPCFISHPPAASHRPLPDICSVSNGNVSLAKDITIVGGSHTGIFVRSVKAGSQAEQWGLKEGSELLELALPGGDKVPLPCCTSEVAHFALQWWAEPSALKHRLNMDAYSQLSIHMASPSYTGADSFYMRVNFDLDCSGDKACLPLRCDDILLVTDTLCEGRYEWRCARVDRQTAERQQQGYMPNYSRAQQQFLVKLRTMALKQKDGKRKFSKKCSENVRLVKAVATTCQAGAANCRILYTLNQHHEENLIPYSLVQAIHVKSQRPVIFSPSILSRGLIERLLQPAESGLDYNTCHPEPISAADRKGKDKSVFLLDHFTEESYGIRLESIQDIITQDKHCLLELGVSSVEGLLKQGIYPIVIHIKPKDKRGRKFKKFLSGHHEEKLTEDACQAEEYQLENLPMLYYTLQPGTWGSTEELMIAIRNAIHSQQRAVVWIEPERL